MNFTKIIIVLGITLSYLNIYSMETQKKADEELLAAIAAENYTNLELALGHGADPNLIEKDKSVLDGIIRSMYFAGTPNAKLLKIAKKLIDSGAQVTDLVLNEFLTSIVDRYLDLPDGPEFFESLLKRRGNLNSYNSRGETALHTLLLRGDYLHYNPLTIPIVVRLLIQYGANVNARTLFNPKKPEAIRGDTSLTLAASILLNVVTLAEPLGIAELSWWIEHRQKVARAVLSIIEELLVNGADPRIGNDQGNILLSLIDWALQHAKKIGLGAEVENIRERILNQAYRLNERDELIRMIPPPGQPNTLYTQLVPREVREMLLRFATSGYGSF